MKKALIGVLFLAVTCTACSTAWVSTLDSILAAAAPALINILQIVAVANGQPMNAGLAAKINSDAGDIKTLAGDLAKVSAEVWAGGVSAIAGGNWRIPGGPAIGTSSRASERRQYADENHAAFWFGRGDGGGNYGGDSVLSKRKSVTVTKVRGCSALSNLIFR